MPNLGHYWRPQEIEALRLAYLHENLITTPLEFCRNWGRQYGLSCEAVRAQINRLKNEGKLEQGYIPESIYPIFNEPLIAEGDAVILPDVEAPLHCANFLNRVLDLASSWGINQCILAGDAVHLGTFSPFNPPWKKPQSGGLNEDDEAKLMAIADKSSAKVRAQLVDTIAEIGRREEEDGASTELKEASKILNRLADQFEHVDLVLGNHEGRTLRVFESALSPEILLDLLHISDNSRPKWRVAPHYFEILNTENGAFQIEHPRNAAKFSASRLCSKYQTHVIMAHSHQLNFTYDPSGNFYAIECGTCSDERRMEYVAQRHNVSPQHALGAVIVRRGYPHLLHKNTKWDEMKKMI
jgi:hypothetical protein